MVRHRPRYGRMPKHLIKCTLLSASKSPVRSCPVGICRPASAWTWTPVCPPSTVASESSWGSRPWRPVPGCGPAPWWRLWPLSWVVHISWRRSAPFWTKCLLLPPPVPASAADSSLSSWRGAGRKMGGRRSLAAVSWRSLWPHLHQTVSYFLGEASHHPWWWQK